MCDTVENIAAGAEDGRQFFSEGNETYSVMCLHYNQEQVNDHKRVGQVGYLKGFAEINDERKPQDDGEHFEEPVLAGERVDD